MGKSVRRDGKRGDEKFYGITPVEQRGWAVVSLRPSYRPYRWWLLLKLSPFPRPSPFAAQLKPSRDSPPPASSAHTSSSPAANGAFNRCPGVAAARSNHDPSHRKSSDSSIPNCYWEYFRKWFKSCIGCDVDQKSVNQLDAVLRLKALSWSLSNGIEELRKSKRRISIEIDWCKRYFGIWKWLISMITMFKQHYSWCKKIFF